MRLILTKNQFMGMNPIYGFQIPEYLKQILNMTEEQYYQAGMEQTQRIINAYLQDFLLNLEWNISILDGHLQEKIKEILFLEFEYLHQNQLWFEKSNDITYSTAGQQTFTFNTNLSEKEGVKLIPDYVIKIIKNSGILTYAGGLVELQNKASVGENQFRDGYYVPDVDWNSKANNIMSSGGNNLTLEQAIVNLQNSTVNNNDSRFLKSAQLVENVTISQNSINWNKLLKSDSFYPNKAMNDYAQIKDLQDLWNGSNVLIQNNVQNIQANQEAITALNQNKVSTNDLQSYLDGKANNDFSNIKLPKRAVNQYVNVDINGNLYYTNASGNLSATVWQYDREYFNGDAVYVDEAGIAVIYLAKNVAGNIGKNPPVSPDFWIKYKADFDLSQYLTAQQSRNEFFAKNGGTITGDVDMSNNAINNVSNLIENSRIKDNETTTTDLWSSQKIQNKIDETALILQKEQNQTVTGTVNFSNDIKFDKSLSVVKNNVGGTFTALDNGDVNIQLNNQDAKFKVNGESVVTDLRNVAFINQENTFTNTQTFNRIEATNINGTVGTLNEANVDNLTATENITAANINATGTLAINGAEVATQRALENKIQQVYDNLGQYNITTWEGNWRSTTPYAKGAMVKYEGNQTFYISNITNNLNHNPSTSPEYWTQTSAGVNVNLDNYMTTNTDQTITGTKRLDNHTYIATGNTSKEAFFGTKMSVGYGGRYTELSADDATQKDLRLWRPGRGSIRLSMDANLPNPIIGLPKPTQDNAAANKAYVDEKFNSITIPTTNSVEMVTFTAITSRRFTLRNGDTYNMASEFNLPNSNYPSGYGDYIYNNVVFVGVTDNPNRNSNKSEHTNSYDGGGNIVISFDKYMLNNNSYLYFYIRNVGRTIENKYLMFQFTMIKGLKVITT